MQQRKQPVTAPNTGSPYICSYHGGDGRDPLDKQSPRLGQTESTLRWQVTGSNATGHTHGTREGDCEEASCSAHACPAHQSLLRAAWTRIPHSLGRRGTGLHTGDSTVCWAQGLGPLPTAWVPTERGLSLAEPQEVSGWKRWQGWEVG